MPLITNAGSNFSRNPTTTNSSATTAPALAPTSKAGENTPPKKPNPNEIDVANIFPIKIIKAKYSTNSPDTALSTVLVPKPITSGTKWPIALKEVIATAYFKNTLEKILTEILLKKIKLFIKTIATIPKSGPAINDTYKMVKKSNSTFDMGNIKLSPQSAVDKPKATHDAIAIERTALCE